MNNFKTKKQIKEYLSKILHSGSKRIDDQETINLIYELVSYSQKEKLENYDHFEVGPDKFRSNCFYIYYKDGTKDDFSYNWIIQCYSPLSKRLRLPKYIKCLITTARYSINDQINKWRYDNHINYDLHIDHYPVPFIKILYDWYLLQDKIEIPAIQQKNQAWMFKEPYLKSWQEYHKKEAKYRALSKLENSKNGSYSEKVDWYDAINKKKL